MKNLFAIAFCAVILLVGANRAAAQDIWVGTSPATGWECYVMTETIHHLGDSDINVATLKMVTKNDSIRQLEYRFWYDFSTDRVRFSNSQGFKGIADEYETPIEWRMWQVIINHNN